MHSRAKLGALGEDHAQAHYERLGYTVIARNVRTRSGELDLILWHNGVLVFSEVRTRIAGPVDPLESIDSRKARQVRRMASAWLASNNAPCGTVDIRLDAVGVTVDASWALLKLTCLEGAL